MDDPDLAHMSDDPLAPYRRALTSLGRDFEILEKGVAGDDEARFRECIATSIRRRGCPVIATGVLGQLWGLVGGPGDSGRKPRLFADPVIRRQTADFILLAQEQDRLAADSIERALAVW